MEPLRPYIAKSDSVSWIPGSATVGQADSAREEIKYSFTTMESLVGHFSQWLPQNQVQSVIEAEKEIFIVRKEVSLEETRLQFLKKCENTLQQIISNPNAAESGGEWRCVPPPQP